MSTLVVVQFKLKLRFSQIISSRDTPSSLALRIVVNETAHAVAGE